MNLRRRPRQTRPTTSTFVVVPPGLWAVLGGIAGSVATGKPWPAYVALVAAIICGALALLVPKDEGKR